MAWKVLLSFVSYIDGRLSLLRTRVLFQALSDRHPLVQYRTNRIVEDLGREPCFSDFSQGSACASFTIEREQFRDLQEHEGGVVLLMPCW